MTKLLLPDGSLAISIKRAAQAKPPLPPGGSRKKHQTLVKTPTPSVARLVSSSGFTSRGPKPWQSVKLQQCPLTDAFRSGCGLAHHSHLTYTKNLAAARQICGGLPVADLLRNADAVVGQIQNAIDAHGMSRWTHAAYLSAVLACVRHVVACESKAKPALKAAISRLQAAHKAVRLLADQPALQNRASGRQAAGFVPYHELCGFRDQLEAGPIKLLLGFMTYIPPCRADLAAVRIFPAEPTDQQLQRYRGNYVVLPRNNTTQLQAHICYRRFKTAKSFGVVKVALPPPLVKLLHDQGAKQREWLFTCRRDATRPLTRAHFSKWASAALRRVTGRPVTLTLIRHAYSSMAQEAFDVTKVDPCDEATVALYKSKLLSIARAMMHSAAQMLQYRFTFKPDGKPEQVESRVVQPPAKADQAPIVVPIELMK